MVVKDEQVRVLEVKSYEAKVGVPDTALDRQELSTEEVQLAYQLGGLRRIGALLAQVQVVFKETLWIQAQSVGHSKVEIFSELFQGQAMKVQYLMKIERLVAETTA